MNLDFLMMADRAEAINGKLYMVGGGFDRVGVPSFPGSANYDIALAFMVEYHETNQPHEFSLAVQDEDNNVVLGPIGGRLEVGRPPGMVDGQDQRVIIVFRGPFPVNAVGNFKWVPVLDGVPERPTRFRVEQMALPQPPAVLPPPAST